MGVNAQTTVPTFTAGQVLTAAQMNDSARTGVPVFATTAARDAGFGGTGEKTLAEGQLCYIEAAPQRFQVYNGTAWIDFDIGWTSYTPTWTNLTVGNATQSWKYAQHGKIVFVTGSLTWGSTTSASGAVSFSLPVTATTTQSIWLGTAAFEDSGTEVYVGLNRLGSSTTVAPRSYSVTGTQIKSNAMTNLVPFTWTTNDIILSQFSYEAA